MNKKKLFWRREKSVISSIRHQGLCGACWAHSVIETIESQVAISKNQSLQELSVQQVIDCAGEFPIDGCNGGDTCALLQNLKKNKVEIKTLDEYPFREDKLSGFCKALPASQGSEAATKLRSFSCKK